MSAEQPSIGDARFPADARLRRGLDFRRVYDRKCSVSDDLLVVYGCANQLRRTRLGLSVSRKVGGAVARNRWKRLLREAFRLKQANIPSGLDLIVIPRQTAKPELGRLMKSLPALARRLAKRLAGAKSANSASEPSK